MSAVWRHWIFLFFFFSFFAAENVHLRAIKEHVMESNGGQQKVLFAFKNQYFIKGNPSLSA